MSFHVTRTWPENGGSLKNLADHGDSIMCIVDYAQCDGTSVSHIFIRGSFIMLFLVVRGVVSSE